MHDAKILDTISSLAIYALSRFSKTFSLWSGVGLISIGLCLPAFADQPSAADLIASLQPAVVNISVVRYAKKGITQGNIAGQTTIEASSHQSSGFFVESSGIVLTSRHVVEDAGEIMVILQDTTRLRASLVATAAQSDLALLRVNPGKTVPTCTVR